ncbi:MAG: sugar-binding protein, partial [Armatimonadota bacterium]
MMCAVGASASSPKPVEIPYVDGITINADPSDWGDRGFRIEMMGMMNADRWNRSAGDFLPTVRLGWDKRGIIVLAQVKDNVVKGSDDLPSLYLKDCVELWAGVNGKEPSSYQLAVSPGANPADGKILTYFWDRRTGKEPRPALTQESAFKLVPGGYIIEVLMPWTNLGISPSKGDEVGFQIVIDDCDADAQTYNECAHGFWCPVPGSTANALGSMYSVKLSDKASMPTLAGGGGEYRFSKLSQIGIRTIPGFIGRPVVLKAGRKQLGSAVITGDSFGWGTASMRIPMPKGNKTYTSLTLHVDDAQVGTAQLGGDPSLARAKALETANLHPDP